MGLLVPHNVSQPVKSRQPPSRRLHLSAQTREALRQRRLPAPERTRVSRRAVLAAGLANVTVILLVIAGVTFTRVITPETVNVALLLPESIDLAPRPDPPLLDPAPADAPDLPPARRELAPQEVAVRAELPPLHATLLPPPPPPPRLDEPIPPPIERLYITLPERMLPPQLASVAIQSEQAVSNYLAVVSAEIAGAMRYPALARRRGEQGTVRLHLAIDATGDLVGVAAPAGGSGSFTRAALAATRRAAPFPHPPAELATPIALHIPISFKLM